MRAIRFNGWAAGFFALALLCSPAAVADDSPSAPPSKNADFGRGAQAIKSKNWDEAVKYLEARPGGARQPARAPSGFAYRNRAFDPRSGNYRGCG
jgi:hypothetical protein